MLKHCLLVTAFFALSVSAAKPSNEGKADSVVYDKPTEWRVFASGSPVTAFAVSKDYLWYVTGEALISSSTKKAEVIKYTKLGSMPGTDLTCVTADASGKIWVGGKNGVAVKSGATFTNYTAENGLPDVNVNAIAVANDGSVWVGTDLGAAVFKNNQWKVYNAAAGLASDKVTAILAAKNGTIWIGSDKGLSEYDGAAFAIHNMKKGMSWNFVKALAEDPKTGAIWAAVGDKDVNCFEGGSWKTYMETQPDITSIMVDSRSRVWFGSATGLVKFNGEEWIYDPAQIGVPAQTVNQMYKDAGGNLWFATEKGVVRLANPYPF